MGVQLRLWTDKSPPACHATRFGIDIELRADCAELPVVGDVKKDAGRGGGGREGIAVQPGPSCCGEFNSYIR
jgi:hypothetical protein